MSRRTAPDRNDLPRPRRWSRGPLVVAALSLVLAACGGTEESPASPTAPEPEPELETVVDPILIVATTSILGDLVANLVGDDGTVRVLIGPGVDPHVFQASAADAAAMRDADLVVANGLLLEEGLVSALDAAEADGVRVLTVADALDPIEFTFMGDHGHSDDDHGHSHGHSHDHDDDDKHDDEHDDDKHDDDKHDHGDLDPHFWWDPMRTATAVELIAAALTELRPETDWDARAAAYNAELMAVHEEMVTLFDAIPVAKRRLITNHDSLGYLEARYGLSVIGTVLPGTTSVAAPNPRDFARLIDLVVAEGVNVIFAENVDPTTLAENLATESTRRGAGEIRVVRIYTDALGEPGSGAETYLGMLRTTARLITDALTTA
jgi:ABC-type Zn uptake system ZnuABC Zn-binding protein ZnuA